MEVWSGLIFNPHLYVLYVSMVFTGYQCSVI